MSDASVLALLAVAPRESVVPARVAPVARVVLLLPLDPPLPALVPLVPSPLRLPRHVAVEALEAGPLLSRQSLSAAMAGSSPSPGEPTYGLVPRSRWPPNGRPCHSS